MTPSPSISAQKTFPTWQGWQFDIAFDPAALEAVDVNEGDFLNMDGETTFFQGGSIDNAAGKITQLSAARLSSQGVTGTGTLLQVTFKAKSVGETELALENFELADITGQGDLRSVSTDLHHCGGTTGNRRCEWRWKD